FFSFTALSTSQLYTLSLHDALPISSFSTKIIGTWATSVTWVDVMVLDINGDGKADIVGRVKESGQWWAGISTGTAIANKLVGQRSEEHTSELQSPYDLVCRLLLEKK